jgi:hypothetical protein
MQLQNKNLASRPLHPQEKLLVLGIRIRIHRICMFLGLQDPDPLVKGTERIRILPFSETILAKNFKNEDNVPAGKF